MTMVRLNDILLFLATVVSLLDASSAATSGDWYYNCQGDSSCGYGRRNYYENDDCQDSEPENCKDYAESGECIANPGWMLAYCKRSCGVCYKEQMEKSDVVPNDDNCVDMHSDCPLWAREMECFVNPAYMAQACPASCWYCVNAKALREQGATETEIERRQRFSLTNFGLWQSIPPDTKESLVRNRLIQMGKYVLELDNIGPGTSCNNLSHNCVTWAAENDSCRTNLLEMLPRCSLACQYCDLIETYHKCRQEVTKRDESPFQDVGPVYNYLVSHRGAIDLVHSTIGSCFHDDGGQSNAEGICKRDEEEKFQHEWVLSLDKKMLWGESGVTPQSRLEDLLKFLKSKGDEWVDVPHEEYKRSGQILNMTRQSEPIVESFVDALSNLLNIPRSLFELEFVRYQRGERYEGHNSVRLHDLWKLSGARLLSGYVVLEAPIEGGAFGFPNLDWLLVNDPQILIWPNVKSSDPETTLERMKSEQLPVVKGELYAAQIWVHQYTFDDKNPCA